MQKQTVKISHSDLVSLLLDLENKGGLKGTIISYMSDTAPKLNKKSRVTAEPMPYKEVRKITVSGARLGVSYKKAVENKAERITGEAVTFDPEKQNGISFYGDSKILQVADKDPNKTYLRLTFDGNRKPKTVFLADGKPVERNALVDFLPPTKDGFIEVRSIGVENIKTLSMNGNRYEVGE